MQTVCVSTNEVHIYHFYLQHLKLSMTHQFCYPLKVTFCVDTEKIFLFTSMQYLKTSKKLGNTFISMLNSEEKYWQLWVNILLRINYFKHEKSRLSNHNSIRQFSQKAMHSCFGKKSSITPAEMKLIAGGFFLQLINYIVNKKNQNALKFFIYPWAKWYPKHDVAFRFSIN